MVRKVFVLIAVGYPLLIVGTLLVLGKIDPFFLFNQIYFVVSFAVAPAALLSVFVAFGRRDTAPRWFWTVLLAVWVVSVTILHVFFVIALAGGV